MESVNAFIEYYAGIRKRTNRLLATIPSGKMDFAYKEGKFTIADQLRHIATIERHMFTETIAGRKSAYNSCGKELADGYDAVLEYFNKAHEESLAIFTGLNDEDMQRTCFTPTGAAIKIGKWLMLLAEHEIHHRAQLYIYFNMLDIKTPPMYGLTSEEVIEKSR